MTNNTPDYNDNLYFEEKKMTDITEQWKKGELPDGWYWVKRVTWCECIDMLYYWSDTFLDGDVPVDNDEIMEVLAPVPTFDEWKASYNCMLENEVLRLKNAQLKELLKECSPYISRSATSRMIKNSIGFKKDMKLLTKIDEAIK